MEPFHCFDSFHGVSAILEHLNSAPPLTPSLILYCLFGFPMILFTGWTESETNKHKDCGGAIFRFLT